MQALRRLMRSRPRLGALLFGVTAALVLAFLAALLAEAYLRKRVAGPDVTLEVVIEDAPAGTQTDKSANHDPSKTTAPDEKPVAQPALPPPKVVAAQPVILNEIPEGPEVPNMYRFYKGDAAFGYRQRPSARVTVIKRQGEDVVFKAAYTTDPCARRVQPEPEGAPPERAVLFVGCSYTFGVGVNDEHTMPWQTALKLPSRRVYNYGVGGYGPQQAVELFKTDLRAEVPQKKAAVIFTFHHEHINRAVGTPRMLAYGQGFPWYEIDAESGRPVRKGAFRQRKSPPQPTGSKLLDAMKDFHGEMLTPDDARMAALLLDEARIQFEKQFESEGFYLLVYPGRQDKLTDVVVNFVKERGMKILDYRALLGQHGLTTDTIDFDRWFIPHDGHPKAELHAKIAQKIVEDLNREK